MHFLLIHLAWLQPTSLYVTPPPPPPLFLRLPSIYIQTFLIQQINATRQKFSQNEVAAATADASASCSDNNSSSGGGGGNASDGAIGRKFTPARGRADFGQLLQKFSKSDASNSNEERSDGDAPGKISTSGAAGVTRHRSFVRRQGAEEKASSSGSEVNANRPERRAPERTQSLRNADKPSMFSSTTEVGNKTNKLKKVTEHAVPPTFPPTGSADDSLSKTGNSDSSSAPIRQTGITRKKGSDDDGNSSSSSTSSSRSGFRSEFMAKRLAGQNNTPSATDNANATSSSLESLKKSSAVENGAGSSAPSSNVLSGSEDNNHTDGRLTFTSGRTGDLSYKDSGIKSQDDNVRSGGVLTLGGVTTTASSDASVSLGILAGDGESSADGQSNSPSVTEEKKSPRSEFLTRLSQSPEKTSSTAVPQKGREVGSFLRSLRSQRASSRSPSVESSSSVQGSAALSQLSTPAAQNSSAASSNNDSIENQNKNVSSVESKLVSNLTSAPLSSASETAGTVTDNNTEPVKKEPVLTVLNRSKPSVAKVDDTTKSSQDIIPEVNTESRVTEQPVDIVTSESTQSVTEAKPRAQTCATETTTSAWDGANPTSGECPESALTSSPIKRSASLRDVQRTDSFETKRKSILKRTCSLSKPDLDKCESPFPVVDPQLAKILQQRKKLVGDVEEKAEEEDEEGEDQSERWRRRSRALSAAEEIEETLK